ncbi:YbaB/EbfC family nucleoid-associated protein [bacterium]|nr:YbaB/EbfC family nucleoid-associated protein [bacterium]
MDMEALMAQAQQLQDKVAAAQDLLAKTTVKGLAGQGDCIVEMSGKYDLIKVTIKPEILTTGADNVAQIVTTAFQDAKAKADAVIDRVMGEATAGMPLPQ